MMSVLRDYYCKAHGLFEAFEPECPQGCKGECVQKIPSAPALLSPRTRFMGELTKDMAARFQVGDFQRGPRFEDYAGNFVTKEQLPQMLSQRTAEVNQMMPERMAEELASGFGKVKAPDLREKTIVVQDPENLQMKI
jgi:hypothetical protein